jgi:hypothetical protein
MLRIFISSTFIDLHDYRSAVRDRVRQLGCVDVAMEHLGARDERPKEECLKLVREGSDGFVGIYAHRYGYVPRGENMSITEAEYEQAGSAGIKRLIYLLEDDVPWPKKHIDYGQAGKRLDALKRRLRANHICKAFTNKDDLAAAYGPFISTCCVTFDDGKKVMVNRYIDFEMGSVGLSPNVALQPESSTNEGHRD